MTVTPSQEETDHIHTKIVFCLVVVVAVALAAPQGSIADNLRTAIELQRTLSAGSSVQAQTAEERAKDYQTTAQSLDLTLNFIQQLASVWKNNADLIQQ
ncbi:hypothetical protein Pcinc_014209 [Petrolisthes cinctipes]|uniref:Uncharacterized protein n=1 Tax=Petrolisthes cinctipes TaxID=88211 RepID=A0AAE1FVF4_PETCI|nr:hypothetical protein Pcinc_014209 [Petrolisthes cinctipes]